MAIERVDLRDGIEVVEDGESSKVLAGDVAVRVRNTTMLRTELNTGRSKTLSQDIFYFVTTAGVPYVTVGEELNDAVKAELNARR